MTCVHVSAVRRYPSTGVRGVDKFCQLGPCTRHAVDLMPLLRILAKGQDGNSPAAGRAGGSVHDDGALGDCDASLGGVTVFILDHPIGSRSLRSRYDPDQYDALRRAASALEDSGVTVKPLPTDVACRFTGGESCVLVHLYYSG
jgi:hypothetical protein